MNEEEKKSEGQNPEEEKKPDEKKAVEQNNLEEEKTPEENQKPEQINAELICKLGYLFTFAVEFHDQTTKLVPFLGKVFRQMRLLTRQQMQVRINWPRHLPEPFNPYLAWLRMKARASWMEEAALAIFGHMAQSKPQFGIVIDPKLSARENLYARFKKLRRSYTNLAKEFILAQGIGEQHVQENAAQLVEGSATQHLEENIAQIIEENSTENATQQG
jgi:hypothetical protein